MQQRQRTRICSSGLIPAANIALRLCKWPVLHAVSRPGRIGASSGSRDGGAFRDGRNGLEAPDFDAPAATDQAIAALSFTQVTTYRCVQHISWNERGEPGNAAALRPT